MFSAARNPALAAELGLDILTPCKYCFGTLKHAQERLARDIKLKDIFTQLMEKTLGM